MIFDYENWFLPALNQYALHGGPLPDPRVFLLIGSEKKLSDIDENVPIYATVASCRALQDLKKVSSAMVGETLYLRCLLLGHEEHPAGGGESQSCGPQTSIVCAHAASSVVKEVDVLTQQA